jgi:hypothetical protein
VGRDGVPWHGERRARAARLREASGAGSRDLGSQGEWCGARSTTRGPREGSRAAGLHGSGGPTEQTHHEIVLLLFFLVVGDLYSN